MLFVAELSERRASNLSMAVKETLKPEVAVNPHVTKLFAVIAAAAVVASNPFPPHARAAAELIVVTPDPLLSTTNAPNVAVVGLTRGSGVTTINSAAARAWGGNGFDSANVNAAATANDFTTVGITANAGYKISFSSVSRFDYRRSSTGPTSGVMQYQVGTNAFVSFITNSYSSSASAGASLATVDLSTTAALQNVGLGTNVTFRIVNFGASASTGTWYIYDVANSTALDFSVSGSVTALAGPPAIAPVLSLLSLTNNQFQFTLTGTTSSNYVIEVSTNLGTGAWSPIYTGAATFLFSEPATNDQRYYRGKIAP